MKTQTLPDCSAEQEIFQARVYTLTLNPSLDYHVSAPGLAGTKFAQGLTSAQLRTTNEYLEPGGKGLNVSRVLAELGTHTQAVYLYAGQTGQLLREELEALTCAHPEGASVAPHQPSAARQESAAHQVSATHRSKFSTWAIELNEGQTRINVKVDSPVELQLNGRGPYVDEEQLEVLIGRLGDRAEGSTFVLAGSYAPGIPHGTYARLTRELTSRGGRVVVDAEGEELRRALEARPFLVKPNADELTALLGRPIANWQDAAIGARELQKLGAQNVVVSLGGDGAVLVDATEHAFALAAPAGTVVSTIGAGDSLVAGFLHGWDLEQAGAPAGTLGRSERALVYGVAAGSATSFKRGLATKDKVEHMVMQLVDLIIKL